MSKFDKDVWTVKCNNNLYECIGYELRGIMWVPVVYFDAHTGESVCATVYEIIKKYKVVGENDHIGATRLNNTEIALLESIGCKWTGCWIEKA